MPGGYIPQDKLVTEIRQSKLGREEDIVALELVKFFGDRQAYRSVGSMALDVFAADAATFNHEAAELPASEFIRMASQALQLEESQYAA